MLRLVTPISSPKMTKMLGFLSCAIRFILPSWCGRALVRVLQEAATVHNRAAVRMVPVGAILGLVFLTGATPQRTANGNVVTSTADPRVRIEVPARASYVGTEAWVLYGIAECRQFVYAEPDSSKIVRRLYWI